MKTHLIKSSGFLPQDDYGYAVTYCGLHSEQWSEEFGENVDKTLTQQENETTCKRCISTYEKQLTPSNNQ